MLNRMLELNKMLNEEKLYQAGNISDTIHTVDFKVSDSAKIKNAIKALETLGFNRYDIVSGNYGTWQDMEGDIIFDNRILLKQKGSKWFGSVGGGDIEQLKPLPNATIVLTIYKNR